MSENGHLKLYNLLGRKVQFTYRVPKTGHEIHVLGIVDDIIRDVHDDKMVIVVSGHRYSIAFPDRIEWVEDILTLEFGKQAVDSDFFDGLSGIGYPEDAGTQVKPYQDAGTRKILISVKD